MEQLTLVAALGAVRITGPDPRPMITALRAQGYGPSAIARHFNATGLPTPSGRGRWHPETVARHADPAYRARNAAYMRTYRARHRAA